MSLSPSPDLVEVLACVLCVEVNVRFWSFLIPPYLPQYANIYSAHQLLPYDVEAVCL